MMRNEIVTKLNIFLIIILAIPGCKTTELSGPALSPERRANFSGAFVTRPMEKMPSLEKRNIFRIGLIPVVTEEIGFELVGLTMLTNEEYRIEDSSIFDPDFVGEEFIRQFEEFSEIEVVDFSNYSQAVGERWEKIFFVGTDYLDVKKPIPGLQEELKDKNIDAVLLIKAKKEIADFIGGTNRTILPQGVYFRHSHAYVYVGFHAEMYDGTTLKRLKHSSYGQGTYDILTEISWKESYDQYTEAEKSLISQKLKRTYKVAVNECLLMFKAIDKETVQF